MSTQRGRAEEERAYYSLNQGVYRVLAPAYDVIARPLHRLRDEVAGVLPLDGSTRVLDVATGTGAQARALGMRAGEVIGIDLSESMLRIARRKNHLPNVTFQRADATELPFDDRTFDVSCVSFALHEMRSSSARTSGRSFATPASSSTPCGRRSTTWRPFTADIAPKALTRDGHETPVCDNPGGV